MYKMETDLPWERQLIYYVNKLLETMYLEFVIIEGRDLGPEHGGGRNAQSQNE